MRLATGNMIPYSLTVGSAAAPEVSLSFPFWGAGIFVLPIVAVYTGVVYRVFRGKHVVHYRGPTEPACVLILSRLPNTARAPCCTAQ
nr:hypothetical protein [uncultured Rhodopila sp.]